ncbi:MAG: hypothetical protein NVSMB21_19440 [Vulcanimicrobiaceae bacterium]
MRETSLVGRTLSESLQDNAILGGLAESERRAILAGGSLVELPLRRQIYWPNEPIADVYFPLNCVLSVVTRLANGSQIEVGTIGREGVSAIPLLLGATTSANESYCQVPGMAIRIDARAFQALKVAEHFRPLLDRYVQAYVNMLGQLAACNRLHNVYERCSRWLLMTQDRVDSPTIRLTHEYLAMMLGSQRAGVTMAAGALQKAGFISYGNGVITIRDRAGLEDAACECYAVAREQFGGVLRPGAGNGRTRVQHRMPTTHVLDLTTEFPRSGRVEVGGYAWLARLADKARSEEASQGGEYVAYCPLSLGWLERVGVSRIDVHERIRSGASDDELVRFLDGRVAPEQKAAGNRFVLEEMGSHLDEQDEQEGRAA